MLSHQPADKRFPLRMKIITFLVLALIAAIIVFFVGNEFVIIPSVLVLFILAVALIGLKR